MAPETVLVFIGVVLWCIWHILQISMETAQPDEEAGKLCQAGSLKKALDSEHSPECM